MENMDVQNTEDNCERSFVKVEVGALQAYNLLLKSREWGYGRSVSGIRKVVGGTEFMIIA